jgi:putative membrane protein
MIAKWLKLYANEKDLAEVEEAVAQAEKSTAGEIVPMIVRESTLSGHVPVIGTLVAFAFFMLCLPYAQAHLPGPDWAYEVGAGLLSMIIGWLLEMTSFARRLFTTAHDRAVSVVNRAHLEFHETGIPLTEGRTGVLIFVSLLERRAVILGDESISSKIDAKAWVEIVNGLLQHMKRRDLRAGFVEAIGKVGVILAREFPIQPGDTNELSNALIVKE